MGTKREGLCTSLFDLQYRVSILFVSFFPGTCGTTINLMVRKKNASLIYIFKLQIMILGARKCQ